MSGRKLSLFGVTFPILLVMSPALAESQAIRAARRAWRIVLAGGLLAVVCVASGAGSARATAPQMLGSSERILIVDLASSDAYAVDRISTDGREAKRLSLIRTPRWSLDRAAFSARGDRVALMHYLDLSIVKLGKNGSTLLRNATITRFPWSPDGRKLVVASEARDSTGIYVVNVDGSGRHRLSYSKHGDTDPAWSPDGRRIAYVRLGEQPSNPHEGVAGDLWIMNVDGTNKRMLARGAPADMAWSPDSRQLVVVSGSFGPLSLFSADGRTARTLRIPERFVFAPTWSADGRSIAVESSNSVSYKDTSRVILSVIDPATRGAHRRVLRRLPPINGYVWYSAPAWSPNGSQLVLPFCGRNGKCALYTIRSTGAGFTRLRSLSDRPTDRSTLEPTVTWH
jgi:TolB protein